MQKANNLFDQIKDLLLKNKDYVAEDKTLLKAKVISDAYETKKELLELLLSDEKIKQAFFKDVNGVLVFDKKEFVWLIESKEFLPDSYTKYMNNIGLTCNDEYVARNKSVVLDFPFKDCLLVGGQDKDDQKRKEIFFNDILASDQITNLLAPKVFTNIKKYTKDGIENITDFNEEDNLIIKGNNLIVLASLLKRYENKVKCIYIDPPYNTGNDGFNYNDNFNHSTWLTFMKNRLELAKRLLTEDGVIFVNIDYYQMHYLKVLMDEIFGYKNFVTQIIWRMGFLSGYKTLANKFIRNHDSILFFSKSNNYFFKKNYIYNKDFAPLLTVSEAEDIFKKFGLDKNIFNEFLEFVNHTNRAEKYPIEDTWNCSKWDKLNSVAIDNSTGRSLETVMISVTYHHKKPYWNSYRFH
ncbi:DNA methyltransferase [Ureaplasma diversum]|uniref:DNA methyltransferase n=1 Tax=Ureaplasma diversum TaxID=42094 RepID=UPI000AE89C73|nr:site-specific DNA-methyltransferase [Ureaplasma diversum]